MLTMNKWVKLIQGEVRDWPVKPSIPDYRDRLYTISSLVKNQVDLPKVASLHHLVTSVGLEHDQFKCPFCGGFALIGVMNAYLKYMGILPPGGLSKVYAYWMSREISGIPDDIPGTTPRALLKVAQKYGICSENMLPFTGDCNKPVITDEMHKEAAKYRIKSYRRLYSWSEVIHALAAGYLCLIATMVTTDNWMDDDAYILEPLGYYKGGHLTSVHGYDLTREYKGYKEFLDGLNSWGDDWGESGHFWLAKHYFNFKMDIGMPAVFEIWAVEMDDLPEPKIIDEKPTDRVKIKEFRVAPQVVDGRTMLPVRELFETAGFVVDWDGGDGVTLWGHGVKIELTIGKKEYRVTKL